MIYEIASNRLWWFGGSKRLANGLKQERKMLLLIEKLVELIQN